MKTTIRLEFKCKTMSDANRVSRLIANTAEPILYHDDETMVKVNLALMNAGLTSDQTAEAIRGMQNSGILFRERA